MRGDLIPPLVDIELHNRLGVDWESLVWVNNHTEEARIYKKIEKKILSSIQ